MWLEKDGLSKSFSNQKAVSRPTAGALDTWEEASNAIHRCPMPLSKLLLNTGRIPVAFADFIHFRVSCQPPKIPGLRIYA